MSVVFAGSERLYSARPSTSVQQHEGQKSDTDFQKISLLNYRSLHPSKKRQLFFAFLLRWSAVADSGVIFSALSSTPVPHGFEAKSKHRAEYFLLLLYRNIQSQKVNTASKSFMKSPLFLYRNIERGFFNTKFKNTANTPLLSYRNIGGRKTTSIFESSQKIHKLVGFHGSKRKKSACLFSEADALLVIFSFTSSAGSAARSRPL